jgi:hypothetical protein
MLHSILKNEYSEKTIANKEATIISELENNYLVHFVDALDNFEKVMKSFAGNKKEAIPIEIRKTDLDNRIVRFMKAKK